MAMDWLLHNGIADMRGPDFLKLYALIIGITLAVLGILLRRADTTRRLAPARVPAELDPYEMAYLREGKEEVARVVVVNLLQRDYLMANPKDEDEIIHHPKHPDLRHLTAIEREVFDAHGGSAKAREVLKTAHTPALTRLCAGYEETLRSEQLLTSTEARRAGVRIIVCALLILVGLGGYKFAVALTKGRYNVAFLVLMGFGGSGAALAMYAALLPRVSARGRRYLEDVHLALSKLRERVRYRSSGANDSDALLLAVGAYGMSELEGTPYGFYHSMWKRPDTSSSGCGGGSCGGGGCGGGCGGCGG